ncbi:hypothetical protein OHA21_11230 [Actinoplanes sp. NBC_00393]|uniref:hypothetical protein n=1 Tax=Actinoplanes sp. NBC_00393 TaxID=2975953 RepID=UPI002E2213DD
MRTRFVLLMLAAVVLVGAGLLTIRFGGDPAAGRLQPGAPPPVPRPTDSTWPLSVPVAVPAASSASTPPPTTGPAPAPTGREATPAPFVHTFAGQPGVRPLPRKPSPTAPLAVPANVDGCDRSYGTRAQCVPWVFPPGVTDKCAWLAERGYLDPPLAVAGQDRQKLDPDGNGIACDT